MTLEQGKSRLVQNGRFFKANGGSKNMANLSLETSIHMKGPRL